MVRRQSSLNQSLQFRLALTISVVLLILAASASVWSFQRTYKRVQTMQDRQMHALVNMVQDDNVSLVEDEAGNTLPASHPENSNPNTTKALPMPPPPPPGRIPPPHEQQTIIDTIDNPDLALLFDYENVTAHLASLPDGFNDLQGKTDTWRAYLLTQKDQRVIVAQPNGFRNKLARNSAWEALMPLLLLLPLLILVVYLTVYRVFKPIRSLTEEIASIDQLHAPSLVKHNIPTELRPFTQAVDDLFTRLNEAMQLNRRLIANAAHQLRTPLTALSLQAEQLQQHDLSPEELAQRLAQLQAGLARQRDLVLKLLALARSEEVLTQQQPANLHLEEEVGLVLQQCLPLALEKNIDLGVTELMDVKLALSSLDFQTLLQNLIENAVRYTPEGGQVDVAIRQLPQHIQISVIDNGIGIDDAHKALVWDAFYRVDDNRHNSSGLGLAIVKNLVDRYHGNIVLSDHQPQGLVVTVTFPISEHGHD